MKATWTGLILCGLVIYYGIVHSATNPMVFLNLHALILVVGGTIAIGFLTYSPTRLAAVMDFIIFGFLFRMKKNERAVARDILAYVDAHYGMEPCFEVSNKPHAFLVEAFQMMERRDLSNAALEAALLDRRNSVKRAYIEDAKILNNIAKYPPHLGLLGAASGMIEMMSALGKTGIETIGAAMAVALSATLWGVGLNNFVFLPLADNSMKASEDEVYLRDVMIECCLMIRKKVPHEEVVRTCLNKLSLFDRVNLARSYKTARQRQQTNHAA